MFIGDSSGVDMVDGGESRKRIVVRCRQYFSIQWDNAVVDF